MFYVFSVAIFSLAVLLSLWRIVLWRPRPLAGVTRSAPLLIGHRGARGTLPENTLAAFEAALNAGLDGLEFDVQRSRDGALVIFHDFTTHGHEVAALTLAELRQLHPEVPTVDELAALAGRYPGAFLNLEIKAKSHGTQGLERSVVAAVRRLGLKERTLISSFNPLSLLRVRLLAPELRTALLFAPDLPWWLRHGRLAGWLHVDAIHPHYSQVTPTLVAAARRRGLMVNTWTVNDPLEVKRVLALGVNAVMADDPSTVKQAAGRV